MLNLDLETIKDPAVREQLEKLNDFIRGNPFLSGEWEFREQQINTAGALIPIKHNLSFAPTDIFISYIDGDYNFYFRNELSDRNYVYGTANGPCFIRFIVGRLSV